MVNCRGCEFWNHQFLDWDAGCKLSSEPRFALSQCRCKFTTLAPCTDLDKYRIIWYHCLLLFLCLSANCTTLSLHALASPGSLLIPSNTQSSRQDIALNIICASTANEPWDQQESDCGTDKPFSIFGSRPSCKSRASDLFCPMLVAISAAQASHNNFP